MRKIKLLAILVLWSVVLFAGCKKEGKKDDSVAKTYTLNVTATNGTVVKNPNQATYNEGDIVQLTATPNSGYVFTSWRGDATGSTNPLPVTMNANKNITANFPVFSELVVNVKSTGATGDGSTDDTQAIQAAINQVAGTGGTVLVPDGTYLVTAKSSPYPYPALELKSNMTFKMTSGATIRLKPNNKDQYAVIYIANATNVNVVGGKVQGERYQHVGSGNGDNAGMGISIAASSNVYIDGVTATECWGDGFYQSGDLSISTNINLYGVVADDNRRQGLSIENVDGMVVRNSIFKNTLGAQPQYGIDIEPFNTSLLVTNVQIVNNKFENNASGGLEIFGVNGPVSNITIDGNALSGTSFGISLYSSDVNVVISNNWIGMGYVGFEIVGIISGHTVTGNHIAAPTPILGNQSGNAFSNNTLLVGSYPSGYPGAPVIP